MKRSEINRAYQAAKSCFEKNGWAVLHHFDWDITDFGLSNFAKYGLVLINLTVEDEYCEKLMYATKAQKTPVHCHKNKKEDIICRTGLLAVRVWDEGNENTASNYFDLKVNGTLILVKSGEHVVLSAGERVTLEPGIWHEFWPESDECIIGEVSTKNDDVGDNYFVNPEVGRYPEIIEDVENILISLKNQ